jgi:uncharacterized membrane protein
MTRSGNLWAIGYDDIGRANQVRAEIITLGWGKQSLILEDVVVGRHPDGSFTLEREPFPAVSNILGCTAVGVRAGSGARRAADRRGDRRHGGGAGTAASATVGIGDDFVEEAERLMKPGTSALFVLDCEGEMDAILHAIRGLDGTVLKTNVDLERAQLIQSTLAAASAQPCRPGGE